MSTASSIITKNDIQIGSPPWPMTALILCGGKSTRMGRAKAFLPYRGTSMITHIVDLVSQLFSEVLLVTNEPELFDGLEIDTVKDIIPHRGPLGGLLSGLLIASHHHSFVIACDMPFINTKLITEMVKKGHKSDMLVLMHKRGIEPLIGVYSKSCITALEESVFLMPYQYILPAAAFLGCLLGVIIAGSKISKPFPFGPALAIGAMIAVFRHE